MHKPLLIIMACVFIHNESFSQTQDPNDSKHEQWEYVLETTGDVLQIALPVAAGLTTLINKDWHGTKQFALSYSTTFIITHVLKRVVQKERPEGRDLYDAFPSGHTSSAFSGASFIQRRYGWKYGKWTYLMATIVGISRMEGPDGWHDIWDVLGGAAIGIGSTYIFTKPYEKPKMELSYSGGKTAHVLTFKYNF